MLASLFRLRMWSPKILETRNARVTSRGQISRSGSSYAGVDVTAESALGFAPFWRAHNLVCGVISTMPIHAIRDNERIDRRILDELVRGEDPPVTMFGIVSDVLLDGNYVAQLGPPDLTGWPSWVEPWNPCETAVALVNGRRVYRYDEQYFDESSVLHVPGPKRSFELAGRGIIQTHREGLGLALGLEEYAARYIDSSAMPTGVLTTAEDDPSPDDIEELKLGWLNRFGGRSREPAVIPKGATFTPLSSDPERQQLLESRQYSRATVADMFGLAGHWLDVAQSSRTYSNVETEWLNLVRASCMWLIVRIERAMSRQLLPRGIDAKLVADAVLRADTAGRYATYAAANAIKDEFGRPLLSHEEMRELENRRPLPKPAKKPVPTELDGKPDDENDEGDEDEENADDE